jgi:hypothetical protein
MSEVAPPPPLERTAGSNNVLADKRQETALNKRQKLAACQNNVPPVHGRANPALHVRTRLSNHQRNLSLDFRLEPNMNFTILLLLNIFTLTFLIYT